jgi:acetyl esterase/lipase
MYYWEPETRGIDLYDKPLSKEQMESTDRSPLLAKSLEGLPRAFLAIAGKDPIRDEGILYAELLNGAIGAENVRMVV